MKSKEPPSPEARGALAPLSQWLAPALLDWLHAKGCLGVTLVDADLDSTAAIGAPAWQDGPASGWRVPLGDAAASTVLLGFASRDALSAAELADVGALFERLRAFPLVHDTRDAVLVDHAEARRLIHDLRNHLNTLLINGTLLARVAATQPSVQRSAQFLENAGLACADTLNRLSELTSKAAGRGEAPLSDRPER